MEPVDLLIVCVRKLGGQTIEVTGANTVDFVLRGIPSFAYVKDGDRLRGSVFIDLEIPPADFEDAFAYAAECQPTSCRADVAWDPTPGTDLAVCRLLFERELDPELISADDPLGDEAAGFFASWWGDDPELPRYSVAVEPLADPATVAPTNAWLLFGSDDSYPLSDEIDAACGDAARGIYESTWTAAKQTEPGDLLFFYFLRPRKAIHFVARAVGQAFFEDIGADGQRWSGRQWWAHIGPMVEIEPIGLDLLRAVTGDAVMLGRSGRYVRPEHAAAIATHASPRRPGDAAALAAILQPVTGHPDHPDPSTLDLGRWRELAGGSLPLESHVERLIVEPLLRLALEGLTDVFVSKAHHAGKRIVDYVVLQDGNPACAIEVKLRVRKSPTSRWTDCKDFVQAADYAHRLNVPAILLDAFDVHLIHQGHDAPTRTLSRRVLLDDDLATIRRHILSN